MIVPIPSRHELLTWISQLTHTHVERLQQLSDGLAFCQIFDKLYPRMINMTKLKKQPKLPLEKEKNFKLLLTAINQMDLCVNINIVDLSHGKVTAILELLQWFFRQYKDPISRIGPGVEKEPRVIKTYVGNLIDRQKTYQKQARPLRSQLTSSRRSLDGKHIQKSIFESERSKSVRSKTVNQSQQKRLTEQKENPSKVKSITLDKEKFEQRCSEKKQLLKKELSQKIEKMSQKKSETKTEVLSQKEERRVLSVLSKALNAQKPKLQDTLIRVTEAVLEGNPELEQKIRRIVGIDSEKKQEPLRQEISPDHQVRNILNSYRNNSEICETETADSRVEKSQSIIYPPLDEPLNLPRQNMINFMTSSPISVSIKKSLQQDKKETVKKSTVKSEKETQTKAMIIKSSKPSQVSSKKENHTQIKLSNQEMSPFNQNVIQNSIPKDSAMIEKSIQKQPQKSFLFDPHQRVQMTINPQIPVTEKKSVIQKEESIEEYHRQAQSENCSISFSKGDKNVWKQNQTFGSNKDPKP